MDSTTTINHYDKFITDETKINRDYAMKSEMVKCKDQGDDILYYNFENLKSYDLSVVYYGKTVDNNVNIINDDGETVFVADPGTECYERLRYLSQYKDIKMHLNDAKINCEKIGGNIIYYSNFYNFKNRLNDLYDIVYTKDEHILLNDDGSVLCDTEQDEGCSNHLRTMEKEFVHDFEFITSTTRPMHSTTTVNPYEYFIKNEAKINNSVAEPTERIVKFTNDKNCVGKWSQCGGIDYKGPTCCVTSLICKERDEYFSQCV